MKSSIEQIAINFSLGKFELVYDYLSEDIILNIIGEIRLLGNAKVIEHCTRISEYFNSVDTKFTIINKVIAENTIIIIGTAEFSKDGKRISFVESSDYYKFDGSGKMIEIKSYCISEKKK